MGDNGIVIYVYVFEYMVIVKIVNEIINYVDENGYVLIISYIVNFIYILIVMNLVDGMMIIYYLIIIILIELDVIIGRLVDFGWVLGNS